MRWKLCFAQTNFQRINKIDKALIHPLEQQQLCYSALA